MSDEATQVRRYLNDIPELIVEASHYLTPGTAPIDPTSVRGTAIFRIPIVPEIFDLLDTNDKALDDIMLNRSGGERRLGVLPTLGLWVSLVHDELEDLGTAVRECCPARAHTVAGEAGWLSEYAERILVLHPDFYRDIEQLWTELRRACRIRKEYVPKCPYCDHRIEGVYGSADAEYPAWYRCTGCSKNWIHEAELKRLGATQPRMTLRQIAAWLNIPLRTLHNWRSAGRFTTDGRGFAEVEHVKRAAQSVGRVSACVWDIYNLH